MRKTYTFSDGTNVPVREICLVGPIEIYKNDTRFVLGKFRVLHNKYKMYERFVEIKTDLITEELEYIPEGDTISNAEKNKYLIDQTEMQIKQEKGRLISLMDSVL